MNEEREKNVANNNKQEAWLTNQENNIAVIANRERFQWV
jgi:hypothetical protein